MHLDRAYSLLSRQSMRILLPEHVMTFVEATTPRHFLQWSRNRVHHHHPLHQESFVTSQSIPSTIMNNPVSSIVDFDDSKFLQECACACHPVSFTKARQAMHWYFPTFAAITLVSASSTMFRTIPSIFLERFAMS